MEPLFLQLPARHARHQGHQARVDARAADQHPQGDRARSASATCRRPKSGARCMARAVLHRAAGKYVIAINDDIDPDNADALLWAMSYRANASLDMHVLPHRDQGHGPRSQRNGGAGRLGADRRHAEGGLPADLAAQARVHGEAPRRSGRSSACRKLKPEAPWFGYSLGEWRQEFDAWRRAPPPAIISTTPKDWSEGGAATSHEHRGAPRRREQAVAQPGRRPAPRGKRAGHKP